MNLQPVLPQEPEVIVEDTPVSYSIGSSSFGLLPEEEGRSFKLIASVSLVSVILAGTFFFAMGIRRPAQATGSEPTQAHTTQVASNVTPASPIPDLKTTDSVGLQEQTPVDKADAVGPTAAKTDAIAAATSDGGAPAAAAPKLQAQLTVPAAVPAHAPAAKPSSKAARAGASSAQKRVVKFARPSGAAVTPQGSSSSLMTIMPDPTPQVDHHAAVTTPAAVPVNTSSVKSAQIPATRAHKQVAPANVASRIRPVEMGKTSTGKIATAAIPATAGTGLVGARGAVSSTGIPAGTVALTQAEASKRVSSAGIPAGTVALTQAEASKKVASAGIPAATTLTVPSKRTVAPAPANLEMVSRRSSGPTKQNN